MNFVFLFAVLFITTVFAIEHLNQPYFYIYEWPEELHDVYPPPNTTLHPQSSYDHAFYENRGAGRMLNPDVGLFQTWQFSLYRNVLARLQVSKYRTRDPNKASAFIIPFDAGVHSYIDHRTGKPRLASPHGWRAIELLKQAQKNETFWRYHGHNHFVFFSITVYQMVGIGVKVFFMNICQNCTAVVIETSPTFTAISGRSKKYWYAAPYPSSFHWWEGIKVLPWEVPPTSGVVSTALTTTGVIDPKDYPERDILSLFIGSVKTANVNSNMFRKTLYSQCQQDVSCQWYTTAHACNGVVNATNQLLLFRRAKFCPAPAGDSITRKSIFDSLLAGCIPVIFARASMSQYLWYFSEQDLNDVAVYIPKQMIMESNGNFLTILRAIDSQEVLRKQQAIARIAPRLQYAVVPERIDPKRGDIWDPPVHDAAAVIIDRVLDRRTIEPIDGFSEQDLVQQKCLQNDIMQNHADYAGLFPGKTKGDAGSNVSNRVWSKNKCDTYSREKGFNASTFSVMW